MAVPKEATANAEVETTPPASHERLRASAPSASSQGAEGVGGPPVPGADRAEGASVSPPLAHGEQGFLFPPPPKTAAELVSERIAAARAEYFSRSFARSTETREVRRSRRKRDVRATTVSMNRLTKRELYMGRELNPEITAEEAAEIPVRPKNREECASTPKPCPFVSCRHHLYLDVSPKTGAIKLNFPDLEVWELPPDRSCSLDIADRKGETLETVGEIMNLTRERIRQVEVKGLAKMQAADESGRGILREHYGDAGDGRKRRLPLLEPAHDAESDELEEDEAFDAEAFASEALDAD